MPREHHEQRLCIPAFRRSLIDTQLDHKVERVSEIGETSSFGLNVRLNRRFRKQNGGLIPGGREANMTVVGRVIGSSSELLAIDHP